MDLTFMGQMKKEKDIYSESGIGFRQVRTESNGGL
jgi:hypothetical protein